MSMIRLDNVSKYYKSTETVSVGMKNVSLEFNLNEFIAITGESGSGKSTLLNVISGLDGYEDGELFLFNEETSHYSISDWEKYRGTFVGFVFQNYNIIDSYTVYQNVVLALEVQGYPKNERKKRALELIDQVGLLSHKNHKASKLSGGQKQRAVIARALAKDCPIIVADEPTGNLDSESGKQVIKLLHDISKNKLVIVVTHDFDQVKEFATRKIKMADGEVIEDKKLKKVEYEELTEVPKIRQMSFLTLIRFGFRNLFSTPKKLIFLLLLQMVLVSSFTIVFSNQIKNVRESEFGESSYFPNVPDTRLLVEKRDGSEFTDTEIQSFKNLRYVNEVYKQSDLFLNHSDLAIRKLDGGTIYIRTSDTAKNLKNIDVKGNRPIEENEIVVTEDDWSGINIGDFVYLEATDRNSYQTVTIGTFKVVGFDHLRRNRIFFSEKYLTQERTQRIDFQLKSEVTANITRSLYFYHQEDEVMPYTFGRPYFNLDSDIYFEGPFDTQLPPATITARFVYYTVDEEFIYDIPNVSIIYNPNNYMVFVKPELYDQIVNHFLEPYEESFLVDVEYKMLSVSVDGSINGKRLIDIIDSELYRVYYPAVITSPMGAFWKFINGVGAVIVVTIVGLLLYLVFHAVTKNTMNARKKDFAIFRSIGTNKILLARLVLIEQLILSIIGFILSISLMTIIRNNLSFIRSALIYMQFFDYVLLVVLIMLIGILIGLKFNKRVFNMSVIETLTQSRGE